MAVLYYGTGRNRTPGQQNDNFERQTPQPTTPPSNLGIQRVLQTFKLHQKSIDFEWSSRPRKVIKGLNSGCGLCLRSQLIYWDQWQADLWRSLGDLISQARQGREFRRKSDIPMIWKIIFIFAPFLHSKSTIQHCSYNSSINQEISMYSIFLEVEHFPESKFYIFQRSVIFQNKNSVYFQRSVIIQK